ncbi:hypothetical protein AC623_06640 [Bacillus sp. FJAT-27231]|uniref:hypothetical protein n=1 Tax=Bacillus sp. FJAT-27231 TaxID=1679168 RepID=UPI000670A4B7|nr:hypothetical protein [Bacillus sp. FJAT-27231]KMY53712.1 hypothetical protein AC623_06640 [Bacillus sp. FJAT-27231]
MKQTKVLVLLFILDLLVVSLYFVRADYFAFIAAATSLISLFSVSIIMDQKSSKDYEHSSLIKFSFAGNVIILLGPLALIILGGIAFI